MTDTNTHTTLATWEAPIHPRHNRTARWYVVAGGVVLGCAAYGIITGAWSVTIVSLLCGALYYLVRDHESAAEKITLTDEGVLLQNNFTRWEDLEGFWFLLTKEYVEMHITRKNPRQNDIVIQTGSQSIPALRLTLGKFLSEHSDRRESLLDFIARFCKL